MILMKISKPDIIKLDQKTEALNHLQNSMICIQTKSFINQDIKKERSKEAIVLLQLQQMHKGALNQKNTYQVHEKGKSTRNIDHQRIKMALAEALDENDELREKVMVLQGMLIESNNQNQQKTKRIRELEQEVEQLTSRRGSMMRRQRRLKKSQSI